MADTGAPWNIPYIEPTDLVRNYPAANELMADAIAAGLTAAGSPGIGSNVVQTVLTTAFSTSTTGSFLDITGLTVTITPSSDTAKILVLASVSNTSGASSTVVLRLMRGATAVGVSTAGTTNGFSFNDIGIVNQFGSGGFGGVMDNTSTSFLDSPASAAAVTYSIQAQVSSSTLFVNRNSLGTTLGAVSSITAIEVAP